MVYVLLYLVLFVGLAALIAYIGARDYSSDSCAPPDCSSPLPPAAGSPPLCTPSPWAAYCYLWCRQCFAVAPTFTGRRWETGSSWRPPAVAGAGLLCIVFAFFARVGWPTVFGAFGMKAMLVCALVGFGGISSTDRAGLFRNVVAAASARSV